MANNPEADICGELERSRDARIRDRENLREDLRAANENGHTALAEAVQGSIDAIETVIEALEAERRSLCL